MKDLKKRIFRLQSKFHLHILRLIGLCGAGVLSSCNYGGSDIKPMYGTETNDIRFFGKIRSQDSLKEIPGLSVRLIGPYGWGDSLQSVTGTQGEYSISHFAVKGDAFKIRVVDTDSALNSGDFKTTIVDIEISGRDVNNLEHRADVLVEKK